MTLLPPPDPPHPSLWQLKTRASSPSVCTCARRSTRCAASPTPWRGPCPPTCPGSAWPPVSPSPAPGYAPTPSRGARSTTHTHAPHHNVDHSQFISFIFIEDAHYIHSFLLLIFWGYAFEGYRDNAKRMMIIVTLKPFSVPNHFKVIKSIKGEYLPKQRCIDL